MESQNDRWWMGGPEMDAQCESFADLVRAAGAGKLVGEEWEEPNGKVARVLLCDQIARGAFRGTTEAFAYDEVACGLSMQAIENGEDMPGILTFAERWFLYVALMHSENAETHELCLARFHSYLEHYPELEADVRFGIGFEEAHYDVIKRFGRYPHRNKALGRENTPEETEFLAQDDLPAWMKSQG
eukprot:scaffold1172_cov247-Pinguiococcus_pyrenoidosus.AAC.10